MAPVCISGERAVAVSAERLWKAILDVPAMPKICAGFIDAVEVDGDGGAGTVTTMKVNPAVEGGGSYKTQLLSCDNATKVVRSEVLATPSGELGDKLKSHSTESKLEAAGDDSCLTKLKVEYELLDGGRLLPEKEKKILEGYFGMLHMIEAYLVAHPAEYA